MRFLGYVSPIQEAIERSAVIVVPSMGEGFGMVALEAMERARPVIAAAIGGLGELVADGETGVLVAPGESAPLARAIVEVAGDLERAARMGEAGRRRALTEFLEERCIQRTEQLYEQAPLVERERAVRHPRDREQRSRAAEAERAVHPVAQHRGDVARECLGIVGRKEQPGHAVGDELRSRACIGRHDGPPGQHPFQHREAEAFPPRGVDDDVAAAVEGRDVSDAPRHEDAVGDAELARERLQLALAPAPRRARAASRPGSTAARESRCRRPSAARAVQHKVGAVSRRGSAARDSRPTARAARRARSG